MRCAVSLPLSTRAPPASVSRAGLFTTNQRVLLGDRRDHPLPWLSPDGRRLALTIGRADHRDIWAVTGCCSAPTVHTPICWRPADLSVENNPRFKLLVRPA